MLINKSRLALIDRFPSKEVIWSNIFNSDSFKYYDNGVNDEDE